MPVTATSTGDPSAWSVRRTRLRARQSVLKHRKYLSFNLDAGTMRHFIETILTSCRQRHLAIRMAVWRAFARAYVDGNPTAAGLAELPAVRQMTFASVNTELITAGNMRQWVAWARAGVRDGCAPADILRRSVRMASMYGHLREWIECAGREWPDVLGRVIVEEREYLAMSNELADLKWVRAHFPAAFDVSGVNLLSQAMDQGALPVVEWLYEVGYRPAPCDWFAATARYTAAQALDWMRDHVTWHPANLSRCGLVTVAYNSAETPRGVAALDWMRRHGFEMSPDPCSRHYARVSGLAQLRWLHANYPNVVAKNAKHIVDGAIAADNLPCLLWARRVGLLRWGPPALLQLALAANKRGAVLRWIASLLGH